MCLPSSLDRIAFRVSQYALYPLVRRKAGPSVKFASRLRHVANRDLGQNSEPSIAVSPVNPMQM